MSAIVEPAAELSAQEYEALFSLTLPPRPYPGLRAFEKDEWPIFFGRERMTDEVVAQLVRKHLLVLHGDSGCGKSSLLRAGVLPRLEQTNARGGARWRTCTVTPGEAPLRRLAEGLAALVPGGDAAAHALEIRRRLQLGRPAAAGIAPLVCREGEHVCILVDQFEELFAHAAREGPEEAQLFIDILIGLHALPPRGLYAALTMRSEFLGACARYRGFAEAVNLTQYLLPRMEHEDVVRAICEPAAMYEGTVLRSVAEWMITDAGHGQDQLPLIQHALLLLHRESGGQPGWKIGEEACTKSLAQRLSDNADAVAQEVDRALAGRHPRLVEDMMRALTQVNSDGHAIRRPCTLRQLGAVTGAGEGPVRAAVGHFRADGVSFLRPAPPAPLEPETLVDISHEALIRCWRRLADPRDGWLVREFRNGLLWRSLLVQVESFERDPENTLSAATYLERSKWMERRNPAWTARYGGGWDGVQALLEASRQARRKQVLLTRIAPASLVLTILLGVSIVQQFQLTEARDRAVQEAAHARRAERDALLARRQAETTRDEALQANLQLTQTVREIQAANAAQAKSMQVEAKVENALAQLREQTVQLQAGNAPAVLPPRVYFHIFEAEHRPAAEALGRELEKRRIGAAAIVVPGIEQVSIAPSRNVLRCFRAAECADEARRIAAILNELLEKPDIALEDLSARYERSTGIRPRHYELWLTAPPVLRRR